MFRGEELSPLYLRAGGKCALGSQREQDCVSFRDSVLFVIRYPPFTLLNGSVDADIRDSRDPGVCYMLSYMQWF